MASQTFTQYLLDVARRGDHDYSHILSAVAVSVKLTAAAVSRGPLLLESATPSPGRDPAAVNRAVRRLATRILLDQAGSLEQLAAVSIAGLPDPLMTTHAGEGRYLLLVEALHGSVNLHENQPVGLAFSVLERPSSGAPCTPTDFLQPGSRQLCGGMALYGPSTVLVLTTGRGVDAFTLDRDVGNFVLTDSEMRIPASSNTFAINASQALHWPAAVKRYVDECVQGADGPRGRDFVMRWNASAVIGVFRFLLNGGVFLVPDTGRRLGLWGVPLLHNAAPLAWLTEQAGGAATTGTERVLDVVPTSLTARIPLICGSADEVTRIERYYREHTSGLDAEPSYPLFHNRTLFVEQ